MYIGTPETSDEDITKLNEAIEKMITDDGGSIVKTESMGRRKLAYPIQKKTEGHYTLFEIEGSGQEIAELERRMRVNDTVMRYITVRVDEDRKTAEKHRARREDRQNKRKSFNGGNQSRETAATDNDAQENQ
jgi:small subunit ribosomal protein S6